jgi:hypothetical protein
VIAVSSVNAPRCAAETLREVLEEHSIPPGAPPIRNLDQKITSYEVLDSAADFVIAYYVDDGSGRIPSFLNVARYSKRGSHWSESSISRKDATFPDTSADCLGSADGLHRVGDFFLIDTHLSPSAGCLIVLDGNLAVVKLLYGWYLATLPTHIVVFHESMIHFAPTHPMRISIYDLDRQKSAQGKPSGAPVITLYPPRNDRLRAQYIERIRPLIGDEQWCSQHDSHCDPEQFESELTNAGPTRSDLVAVNDQTYALAFAAEFSARGIVPEETIKKMSDLKQPVVYVYRFSLSGFNYREFPLSEMKSRFGATSIEELVNQPVLDTVFSSGAR